MTGPGGSSVSSYERLLPDTPAHVAVGNARNDSRSAAVVLPEERQRTGLLFEAAIAGFDAEKGPDDDEKSINVVVGEVLMQAEGGLVGVGETSSDSGLVCCHRSWGVIAILIVISSYSGEVAMSGTM